MDACTRIAKGIPTLPLWLTCIVVVALQFALLNVLLAGRSNNNNDSNNNSGKGNNNNADNSGGGTCDQGEATQETERLTTRYQEQVAQLQEYLAQEQRENAKLANQIKHLQTALQQNGTQLQPSVEPPEFDLTPEFLKEVLVFPLDQLKAIHANHKVGGGVMSTLLTQAVVHNNVYGQHQHVDDIIQWAQDTWSPNHPILTTLQAVMDMWTHHQDLLAHSWSTQLQSLKSVFDCDVVQAALQWTPRIPDPIHFGVPHDEWTSQHLPEPPIADWLVNFNVDLTKLTYFYSPKCKASLKMGSHLVDALTRQASHLVDEEVLTGLKAFSRPEKKQRGTFDNFRQHLPPCHKRRAKILTSFRNMVSTIRPYHELKLAYWDNTVAWLVEGLNTPFVKYWSSETQPHARTHFHSWYTGKDIDHAWAIGNMEICWVYNEQLQAWEMVSQEISVLALLKWDNPKPHDFPKQTYFTDFGTTDSFIPSILDWSTRDVTDIFDMSIREPATTGNFGQSMASKRLIYKIVRGLGINKLAISAYYFDNDFNVDSLITDYLTQVEHDPLRGAFGMMAPGDSKAIEQLRVSKVPNVDIEASLSERGGRFGSVRMDEQTRRTFSSIQAAYSLLPHFEDTADGVVGAIYLNLVDAYDVYKWESSAGMYTFLKMLQFTPIRGVLYEEFRGTGHPAMFRELAVILRSIFPNPLYTLLVHVHELGGNADASSLAAVEGGANGLWAGLSSDAAIGGHGSSSAYLLNLQRFGAPIADQAGGIQLKKLVKSTRACFALNNNIRMEDIAPSTPVIGRNAFQLSHVVFKQTGDNPNDIPATLLGEVNTFRVAPLIINADTLLEVLKQKEYVSIVMQYPSLITAGEENDAKRAAIIRILQQVYALGLRPDAENKELLEMVIQIWTNGKFEPHKHINVG